MCFVAPGRPVNEGSVSGFLFLAGIMRYVKRFHRSRTKKYYVGLLKVYFLCWSSSSTTISGTLPTYHDSSTNTALLHYWAVHYLPTNNV